jgi:hypothetical protein
LKDQNEKLRASLETQIQTLKKDVLSLSLCYVCCQHLPILQLRTKLTTLKDITLDRFDQLNRLQFGHLTILLILWTDLTSWFIDTFGYI